MDVFEMNGNDCDSNGSEILLKTVKMMQHPAYENPYEWSTEDFDVGRAVGRGKFGRVYIARERESGFMVAMKVMFKSQLTKWNLLRIPSSSRITLRDVMNHPWIVQMKK
uniref:Protein kinase domain-containing protein n=1 Tax=Anopheles epiroticus TaxID=199890 RepID=A0A182P0J3_9DIPT